MPIMRVKEIRDLPSEERIKRLNEFRTELLRLKTMVKAGGSIENPTRIRVLQKTIAQILTIEHEQKLGIETQKREGKRKK
jgi:large subunit ribosomal protein L29